MALILIPDHFAALTLVLAIGWILYRWGTPIFLAYAIYHFWTGEWFFAGLAFAVAWFIEAVKAAAMLLARLDRRRGPCADKDNARTARAGHSAFAKHATGTVSRGFPSCPVRCRGATMGCNRTKRAAPRSSQC
jgi:hypothetical protein